jgi:hypothetical protein
VSFNDRKTNPIAIEELSAQAKRKGLDAFGRVVVLGGKKYVEIAGKVFTSSEIYCPLSGCKGIGYMMGRLNDAIKSGIPLAPPSNEENPSVSAEDNRTSFPQSSPSASIQERITAGGRITLKVDADSDTQGICERVHAWANTLQVFDRSLRDNRVSLCKMPAWDGNQGFRSCKTPRLSTW